MPTFSAAQLKEFSARMFLHFGVPLNDAEQAAEVLSLSDLRGIDSHGVARLHTYFDMLTLGKINARPNIAIVRDKKSVCTVDGDNGLGLVVGPKANQIAMEKAAQHGSGWVSVCNTNHYGIASYYSLKALERDMIGWSMTNIRASTGRAERAMLSLPRPVPLLPARPVSSTVARPEAGFYQPG